MKPNAIARVAGVFFLGAWGIGPGTARSVCINEVLYDPPGSDQGAEFVELYNPDNCSVSLEGWTLESGNGASPGDWRVQWRGVAGQHIEPAGFFLIAGQRVDAPAQARAGLALQNGPDAVRLVSPGGVADLLGWGDLSFEEYFETAPSPDVPSGWALARIPDGTDTDSNAADFAGRRMPSPGASNVPEWALVLSEPQCDPPLIDSGSTVRLKVTLSNFGARSVDLATLACDVRAGLLRAEPLVALSGVLDPEESRELVWDLHGDEVGVEALRLALIGAGGGAAELEVRIRVGRGSVIISEILYDPADEEGEWVELQNLSQQAVSLDGWRLMDGSGRSTVLGPERTDLVPGGRLLVAQDPARLRGHWPDLPDGLIVERSGSWPSLNNTINREIGYADQVLLLDGSGLPCDYVRYLPGDLDGSGVSLERWIEGGRLVEPLLLVPCSSPGGATPGSSSWLSDRRESGSLWLRPQPDPFCPDREGEDQLCRIAVPEPEASGRRVTADIFSMAGRRVATLTAGARAAGPMMLVWDGRAGSGELLPTGLYLVRIVLDSNTGARTFVRPLTLVRG